MRGIHINMLSPIRIHETREAPREDVDTLQRLSDNYEDNNVPLQSRTNGNEEIDRPDFKAEVTQWDVIFVVFSIITHLIDIVTDINLAGHYLINNKIEYFAWTIIFIVIPTIINTFISFRMNDQDVELNKADREVNGKKNSLRTATQTASERKGWCILVILFQLAPLLRYIDSLRYTLKALKCKKNGDHIGQKHYYLKMIKEDQDVALLRVFECFLEAAPQQILQLTILLRDDNNETTFQLVHQICSIFGSLVSMGWSMASYHRNIRLAQLNKPNISKTGTVLQFLWHFCVTVSRILSISVVASKWPLYTSLGCAIHWLVMTTWLITNQNGIAEFCRDKNKSPSVPLTLWQWIRSTLFASTFGTVYLFTYLNPTEGRTFTRHLFYYALCLIENGTAAVLWAMAPNQSIRNRWYFELLIVLCTVPFCIGITAMILYYLFFHPTTTRQSSPAEQPALSS